MAVNIETTLAAVDVDIATYWQDILDLEADYLVANGKYAQALSTHDTVPEDGNGTAPENLADSPTDQTEDWEDLVTLPATMACALALDVYQTANAWGWVATFDVRLNGVIWRRQDDQGPLGRDRDWFAWDGDALDTLEIAALACWTMNETSGTRYDSIGTNHLTEYNTVPYTANAVVGNAAVFYPANKEYFGLNTDLFSSNADFTLCGWVYFDTTVSGDKNQKIMQLFEDGREKGKIEWDARSPKFKFKLFNKEVSDFTPVDAVPDTWMFLEYYYDSANGAIGGSFNNGDCTEEITVDFVEDSINKIKFGAMKTRVDPIVRLDQWCLFDKLLTRTELNYLYNDGNGREPG